MSGYLQRLVAQARGAAPELRPRPRFRFEPEGRTEDGLGEIELESETAPPSLSRATPPIVPPPASLPMQSSAEPSSAPSRQLPPAIPPAPSVERSTERVVRVEQRETTTEHVVEHHLHRIEPLAAPAPAIRTMSADKPLSVPSALPTRIPEGGDRQPDHRAVDAAQPTQQSPLPVRREVAREDLQAPPRFAVETRPAVAPADERTLSSPMEAVPEITISIGVLDIRLTRPEPVAPIRPPVEPRRETAALPLADYLARRSGSSA